MPDLNFVSFLVRCLFLCLFSTVSSIQFLERSSTRFILDLMGVRLGIRCIQEKHRVR